MPDAFACASTSRLTDKAGSKGMCDGVFKVFESFEFVLRIRKIGVSYGCLDESIFLCKHFQCIFGFYVGNADRKMRGVLPFVLIHIFIFWT